MTGFDQEDYHDFVLNYKSSEGKNVVGFFPEKRKLVSGRMSFWYWNGRILLDYKNPMDELANHILNFCDDNGIIPDYFVNVPEGVDKLTDYLNAELGGKQVQARAKSKEHGDPRDAHFIGPVEKGDRVLIFEDVTTTGGSLINQMKKCLDSELDVIATLCECNRMEKAARGRGDERVDFDYGVSEAVSRLCPDARHYALTDATRIVPAAFELWTPPGGITKEFIANGLWEEYEDHGIVRIHGIIR
jgi:orotate phosphoribosyltransferase